MLGRRNKRPEEDALASPGVNTTALPASTRAVGIPVNADDLIAERLRQLEDRREWEQSHFSMVLKYNVSSLAFWVLCICSMAFALLNGFHGFMASGGSAFLATAMIIGLLYFSIELTVPISAHLMSWGSKGQARWGVRMVGLCAYVLGVIFSLVILQGKFSSGAGNTAVRSQAAEMAVATDQETLKRAKATVEALRPKVRDRSADSIMSEMKGILATPVSRTMTLGDFTQECQGVKRDQNQRNLCKKYDDLRIQHADAIALARAEETIRNSVSNLMDKGRTEAVGLDVQDKIFAQILGVELGSVQMFKSSLIAVVAALLTHLLWAAHGVTVNQSIASARDELFERKSLERAVERQKTEAQRAEEREASQRAAEERRIRLETEAAERKAKAEAERIAAETQARFMATKSGAVIAAAVEKAPLKEQPVAIQIQRYFTERCLMGPDFSQSVGIFHDDYNVWCRNRELSPVTVERFVQLVKDIGMHVSADGRIVGAALKAA